MTNETKSFRDFLKAEFQNRLQKNPHYRLLDFAKDLSTPISRMSEIMSGRSGISTQRALHYADSLNLDSAGKSQFLQLVSDECSRTKWTRKNHGNGSLVSARKMLSETYEVPAHKKEEFLRFLKSTIEQWSTNNPVVDTHPTAKVMIEAVDQSAS